MEKYDNLGMVGEGSYGMVMKCKHKESGQIVAIKKFLESEDDKMVKKIAMREVRMLRKLRHENLVNLIEVFRRRKRLYLVFEFVDHTVLDDLEKYPNGLSEMTVRKILWQVLRGVEFCHSHNIIHRDIKPENILNSRSGVIKLCDFGFARTLAAPGEIYTDYVATRWYRAPELLVGDTKYGRPVDIWAVGCLITEMLTGDPLFPGDSDIDQLYHIIKCFGNLCPRHSEIFQRNPLFAGMRLPDVRDVEPLEKRFPKFSSEVLDLMKQCLRLDPNDRPSSSLLLRHEFFKKDNFEEKVIPELRARIQKDNANNALARKEANEKKEQEKKKKKLKEMASESKDTSNIPSPKKSSEAKNVASGPAKDSTSPKKENVNKGSNKTPTMTPSKDDKRSQKEAEKENKNKANTPKQLPAVDSSKSKDSKSSEKRVASRPDTQSSEKTLLPKQQAKSSEKTISSKQEMVGPEKNFLPKSVSNTPTTENKNSMPQLHKKKVTIDLSDSTATRVMTEHHTMSNGILKTPPTKHVTIQEPTVERESKRKGARTPREVTKLSSSDTLLMKEKSQPRTPPNKFDFKQIQGHGKKSPKNETEVKSSIPPLHSQQAASKSSTPDPLLVVTSSSSPHTLTNKQATVSSLAGGPSFRGSDKIKKGTTVSSRKNDNMTPQGSFDRTMYPDKTSHFEKMMISMSGTTSISHPAIKKSNQSSITQQGLGQYQYKLGREEKTNNLPLWPTGNTDNTFHLMSSVDSSTKSIDSKSKFEEKRHREKSPKHSRKEAKSYHHGMDEKFQRELKPETKHVMRLPDLAQKSMVGQERDYFPDLKSSNVDSPLKMKKSKNKSTLMSIPVLDQSSSSKQHKSRSPSPNPLLHNESNFPSVHFKN
uniref:Cyclin-dependent kinase-like 2 n=1 Tax=Phallusia mammillata TaxID=59560 RepID=A0A6F9D9J6_9ASCI|nr:cyclin-dependent kinase-like 2 [Phallusia mammillata]